MNRRVRPGLGLWLLVWVGVSGCATGRHTATNPFVKPGKPTLSIGEPLKLKVSKAAGESKASRHRPADVRPSTSFLPTVENRDPALSAALLQLAIANTPEAHLKVADRYRVLGILDMAYDHYLRASQLDRKDAAAYEGLARIWRDWGFAALGAADASRAVYYAPSSASAHNTLGTVLAAIGHPADARREYERAVQLDPRAGYAWNNLCSLSFLEGDTTAAARECRAALSVDPGLTAARNTLTSVERSEVRTVPSANVR